MAKRLLIKALSAFDPRARLNVIEYNTDPKRYTKALAGLHGIAPQVVDPRDESTYKDYTVIVDESAFGIDRDTVAVALKAEGIDTRPYFYPPVHRQQAYTADGVADLPATDWVAQRVISLPLWRAMPPTAVDTIAEVLAELSANADAVRQAAGGDTEGADACVPS